MGPFNDLRSCGTLKERSRHKCRNDGLPSLKGWLASEMFRKIVVGKGDANLKEQVCPAFNPAHLLLLDHPPFNRNVDTRFSSCGGYPLPFEISCTAVGDRTPVLLDLRALVEQTAT